jgi:hypothetical protein
MAEPTGADTDWVNERSLCTTYELFRQLARRVKADVEKRNEMLNRIDFGFDDNNRDDFFVVHSRIGGRVVRFALTDHIAVSSEQLEVSFQARAVYTIDAQCRLEVGDRHLHVWQVARMALEEMFFDT